ncbi:MAG: serine/threonine protein kinase, partial [Lentisphaeraceae bacterium]|nr:serine/threonine protein kinase [Lentisphaeraceae bacterium]
MINHTELLPAGRELGGFKIVESIGRGNMGLIYKAVQINLNRPVALKVLFKSIAKDEDFVRSFFREAQAAAAFTHQNIVQAFDVGETDDGFYYFAMELIEGGDISQKLTSDGAFSPRNALEYILGIADGLDYGSTLRKLTHGDIKPANIMITPEGVARVLDFGLARSDGGQSSSSSPDAETLTSPLPRAPTAPGLVLGTAAYMSPEQARGRRVDKRTDIWSFGVVV